MKLTDNINGVDIYDHRGELYIKVADITKVTDNIKDVLLIRDSIHDSKEIAMADILAIRNKYSPNPTNRYIKTFSKYREEIYTALCTRYNKGNTNKEYLENAFDSLSQPKDTSLPLFFFNCGIPVHGLLMDFIFIMNKGLINAAGKEAGAAKKLTEWISDGKITLNDIEDAYFWMRTHKNYLSSSLSSLASIIADYEQTKNKPLQNGKEHGNLDKLIARKIGG